ncbi:hypothetical protein SynBIOSU31_02981 [Synechococcus sp. BIOS-U3-1]|nr:hypothetical protein SynBIOSU31_02981 [Synechococcus sp. BIOS-U3-1]
MINDENWWSYIPPYNAAISAKSLQGQVLLENTLDNLDRLSVDELKQDE